MQVSRFETIYSKWNLISLNEFPPINGVKPLRFSEMSCITSVKQWNTLTFWWRSVHTYVYCTDVDVFVQYVRVSHVVAFVNTRCHFCHHLFTDCFSRNQAWILVTETLFIRIVSWVDVLFLSWDERNAMQSFFMNLKHTLATSGGQS